ncbi:MAG TPA: nucleoside triphosphate pyrophosphohydrolase [Steroidobacteraceae bacterium]|jgi:MazG family protein|nr:nucleoside triphosphate pyrophosphohydrolase [Steroidobacteraceae bacterium]
MSETAASDTPDGPGGPQQRDGGGTGAAGAQLQALLELMRVLRDPLHGCPWDRTQSFATIAPFTIEEAYELADAIGRNDFERLRDELGDLLFQVVFHARIAEEQGRFDFAAVARAICDKLVRRHPHIFAERREVQVEQLHLSWEAQKARERAAAGLHGVLADVPRALPALARAAKLGRRAARVGFDWEGPAGVRAKVDEELAEIDAAGAHREQVAEEIGDLLFTIANWARHLQVDAEDALRGAALKFERRFERMEQAAGARGVPLDALSAAQWDELWRTAKLPLQAPE